MKVTGKLTLLTLLLLVASLLCGSYTKGSPALFEPKFEQSAQEASTEVKVGERKETNFSLPFNLDGDFSDLLFYGAASPLAYQYTFGKAFKLQKHALVNIPRYLLFHNLKVHIC